MSSTRHARPGLYWDWCATILPLWYTFRWWGARGFTWLLAHCEVHLCGGCCSAWPLRLQRRWISCRCLCQNSPIRNQMEDCRETHSSGHSKACINANLCTHSKKLVTCVTSHVGEKCQCGYTFFSPDLCLKKKQHSTVSSILD